MWRQNQFPACFAVDWQIVHAVGEIGIASLAAVFSSLNSAEEDDTGQIYFATPVLYASLDSRVNMQEARTAPFNALR